MRLPESLRRLAYRLAGREPSIEDERLFALFRNRVELKKELTALDDERHRLLDRLKLQEGATMRVEEQMAALEQYLGRPDEGYKSLAYYQLQGAVARRRASGSSSSAPNSRGSRRTASASSQLAEFDRAKRERVALRGPRAGRGQGAGRATAGRAEARAAEARVADGLLELFPAAQRCSTRSRRVSCASSRPLAQIDDARRPGRRRSSPSRRRCSRA